MYFFYSQVLYQRTSVNYTSEFRDIFEANTCKICCLMKVSRRFVRTEKLQFSMKGCKYLPHTARRYVPQHSDRCSYGSENLK